MNKFTIYGITFLFALGCMIVMVQNRPLWSQESTSTQQTQQAEGVDTNGSLRQLTLKNKLQQYMDGVANKLKETRTPAGRNMQVLTHLHNKVELQTTMQMVQNSLGVTCKYCHNLTGFWIDEEGLHKDVAREMMKLQISINQQIALINEKLYKNSDEKLHPNVTCNTCHQGQKKPPSPDEKWDALLNISLMDH